MFPRRLNQGIPIAAPQSATPADGSGGSFLSVEIFCAVNVPNSAIAMRDRAARTQGGAGVRHTRDFRPVFWTHRDPLITRLRLPEALCVRLTRCLRLTRRSRRRTVTPVSTGRPCCVYAKLQAFAKNCNQINNLSHFCQILAFLAILGRGEGEGLGQVVYLSLPSSPCHRSFGSSESCTPSS